MTQFSEASLDAFLKTLNKPLDCIVVGSGISGLTCASLLVQSGVSVLVLERSAQAGGSTHGFRESGYDFEMGLQEIGSEIWLGNNSKEPFAHVLATACKDGVQWNKIQGPSYSVHLGKENFVVQNTWQGFRADLLAKFPDESAALDKFHDLVVETRKCAVDWMFSRMPSTHPFSTESSGRFKQLANRTVESVLDEITLNMPLRYLLTFLWAKMALPPRIASWGAFCLVVGQFLFDGVAFPVGGAESLEKCLISIIDDSKLGKCFVNCKVQSLATDSSCSSCLGVTLDNGREIFAQQTVSAIGAANTYERLVPITMSDWIKAPLKGVSNLKYASYSVLQVFFGFEGTSVDLHLPQDTHWFLPDASLDHTDAAVEYFLDPDFSTPFPYVHVSFPSAKKDPTNPKSTAVLFAAAHYDWFKGMKPHDVEKCSEMIVTRLSKQLFETFPQLKTKVKFVELATPLAVEFHLGSQRGAMVGLGHSPSRFEQEWLRPKSPIAGLTLAGQDVHVCTVVGASVGGYMGAVTAFPDQVSKTFPHLF